MTDANPYDTFGFDGAAPVPPSAPQTARGSVSFVHPGDAGPSANPYDAIGFEDDHKNQPYRATGRSMAANAAAGTNESVMDVAGAPVDFTNFILRKIGVPVSDTPIFGSQWLKNAEASYGGSPDQVVPQNEAERIARGAGQGVAAALIPGGAVASMERLGAAVPAAVRTIAGTPTVGAGLTGAASGAGAQAAADAVPDPYKPFAAAAGGVIAGVPIAGAAAIPRMFAGHPPITGPSGPQVVQAADRLSTNVAPVEIPRAAATDNMAAQRLGAVVSKVPIAGDPLVEASRRTIGQMGTVAGDIHAQMGGASPEQAGNVASAGIRQWVGPTSRGNVSRAYNAVDAAINPTVTTPLDQTLNAAADILADRHMRATSTIPDPASGIPLQRHDIAQAQLAARQLLMQGRGGEIANPGNAVGMVMRAVQEQPHGLTYQGVKGLRQSVGEMLDTGVLPADMSGAELKRLYGPLTDDLRGSVAIAGGNRGLQLFDRANNYARAVAGRREQVVRLLGGDAASRSEEAVFAAIQRAAGSTSTADANLLRQARRIFPPDEWQEVASGVVGKLGRDPEGNFTADRFARDYGKLSDAGKATLLSFPGGQQVRQSLDDLATVSARLKQLREFANPSGTGHVVAGVELLRDAVTDPLQAIGAIVGGRVLARALAQPATVGATANWAQRYLAAMRAPSRATVANLRGASTRVAATFGAKLGMRVDPESLMRLPASVQPAGAQQDQNDGPDQ